MISRDFVLCFPMLSLSYFVLFCFVSLFVCFVMFRIARFVSILIARIFYLFKTFKNEYKRK